jgi:peptide/nickel transport system substrate-binding protein
MIVFCLLAAMSIAATARVGGWLDEIVFFEEVDQAKVLSMMGTGEVQFFANAFMASNLATIESLGLPYVQSYGSYNTILLNPEGPLFADGRFNPMHDEIIQQALNRLIDRQYLIDELSAGLGIPQYTVLLPVSPTYAQIADVTRTSEIEFAFNKSLAIQQINDRMLELGCTKIDGKWAYNGQKITIIGIIRSEDERLQIGNFFADWLEECGFLVDRQIKRSSEASPIWNRGEPTLGKWSYYTGGWIATAIDRGSAGDFCLHYTDVCYPTARTVGYADEFPQQMYDWSIRVANGDFKTAEERIEMFRYLETTARQYPLNLWLYTEASPWVIPNGLSVTSDLMGGIFGGRLWSRTMTYVDADGAPIVGGSVRIANQGFLVDPWNAPAGSNWLFDSLIQSALQDPALFSDPFTGLAVRNFVERVDVTVKEGLPVFAGTKDWCTLTYAPTVAVPADAWADWDAVAGDFIPAGAGKTALAVIRYTYPQALWTYKWHDGSPISMGDLLMDFIYGFSFDPAKPESPYYDSSAVATYESNMSVFKGLKIISVNPLVFDVYTDGIDLDAEVMAINNSSVMWFTYVQGTAAWHTMALGLMSEAAGLAAFSNPKATEKGVDWLNFAAGPTLNQMVTNLAEAQVTKFLPYPNVLGKYVTQQEIVARYANAAKFFATYGHLYLGTGPYFVKTFDPLASIVVLNRFADYAFDLDRFMVFAEPKLPDIAVAGPSIVFKTDTVETVFTVNIQFQGEAYPAAEIATVSYIVIDGAGQIGFSGKGVVTGDGAAVIRLAPADVAKLVAGSSRLEVICTVTPVALMATAYTTFIAQ